MANSQYDKGNLKEGYFCIRLNDHNVRQKQTDIQVAKTAYTNVPTPPKEKPTAPSTNSQKPKSNQVTDKPPPPHVPYRIYKRYVISKWRVDGEFKEQHRG